MTSLFERHANGPPSGPDLSYHAASWPARTVFKNASEPSQRTKPNIYRISGVFTSRLQDNECIRQDGMMTSHIFALVEAVRRKTHKKSVKRKLRCMHSFKLSIASLRLAPRA